jgi:hypothetical protein
MDADMSLDIGDRRLYAIFERKYGSVWNQSMEEMGGYFDAQRLDSLGGEAAKKWHDYLEAIGMAPSEEKPREGKFVMDPCAKMGQSLSWPLYIKISEETALKILALGDLP